MAIKIPDSNPLINKTNQSYPHRSDKYLQYRISHEVHEELYFYFNNNNIIIYSLT